MMRLFVLLLAFFTTVLWAETIIIPGHRDGVWKLAYSQDGRYLLSSGGDGTVKVWGAHTCQPIMKFSHDSDFKVYDAVFFPDCKRIISTSLDGSTYVWDILTGEKLFSDDQHIEYVPRVAVSLDGKYFFTAGADDMIVKWDATNYKVVDRYRFKSPVAVIPLPKRENLAVVMGLQGVVLWDYNNNKTLQVYRESPYFFSGIAVADGNSFICGGTTYQDAKAQRIALDNGKIGQKYYRNDGVIWQTAATKSFFAASLLRSKTSIWEIESGKHVFSTAKMNTMSVAITPDERKLAIGTTDGEIHLFAIAEIISGATR